MTFVSRLINDYIGEIAPYPPGLLKFTYGDHPFKWKIGERFNLFSVKETVNRGRRFNAIARIERDVFRVDLQRKSDWRYFYDKDEKGLNVEIIGKDDEFDSELTDVVGLNVKHESNTFEIYVYPNDDL